MDNNFYNILQTFKRLDEGMTKEAMWRDAERMTRDQFCEKWGHEHAEFWDNIMGDMDEGSMADAEKHTSGAKFGGYWKGTDPNPPKPGMGVGGMEESGLEMNYVQGAGPDDSRSPINGDLEEELMAAWEQFVKEYSANEPTGTAHGGQTHQNGYYTYDVVDQAGEEEQVKEAGANNPPQGQDPIKQRQLAQQTAHTGQAFQKLQNLVGIKTGVGASQAAKTAVANAQNPNVNPTTGAGMDQTGKKIVGALGKGVEDALVNADPADANKLIQNLQQIKQKAAGTL